MWQGSPNPGAAVEAALEHGDLALADELLCAVPSGDRSAPAHVVVRLTVARGDPAVAAARARLALADEQPAERRIRLVEALVEAELWSGRADRAVEVVVRAQPVLRAGDATDTLRVAGLAMRSCAELSEQASRRADAAAVRLAGQAADDLRRVVDERDLAEVGMLAGRSTRFAEEADWFAECARLRGFDGQENWWRTVAARWREHDRPHREGYAWWQLARVLAARKDEEGCREALRRARAAGENHVPLAAAVRGTADAAGVRLHPVVSDEPRPGTLTRREREVMALVGTGLTATAAARRLQISPRTVAKHLENAYAKLGADNRVVALHRLAEQSRDGLPTA